MPIRVPLWLALALKESGKCTVELEDWFTPVSISNIHESERRESKDFQVRSDCTHAFSTAKYISCDSFCRIISLSRAVLFQNT